MDRPKEVEEALHFLAKNTSSDAFVEVLKLLNYIQNLEHMVDDVYKKASRTE